MEEGRLLALSSDEPRTILGSGCRKRIRCAADLYMPASRA